MGARLRAERERLGLSQTAFANACGITRQSQNNFEGDKNLPNAAVLIAAAGLGVDVGYVLTGRSAASSDDESALLDAFRNMPDRDRAALLRGVKR